MISLTTGRLNPANLMLRIGGGKHDDRWFFRIDLWARWYRLQLAEPKCRGVSMERFGTPVKVTVSETLYRLELLEHDSHLYKTPERCLYSAWRRSNFNERWR